jgi:ribonuclease R
MAEKAPRKNKPALPTREAVLEFIRDNDGHVSKRDIARAFQIKGNDKIALKRLLKDMAEDGQISGRAKNISEADTLPPVTVLEITGRDRDGDLLAAPIDWQTDNQGPAPLITLSPQGRPHKGKPHVPAAGKGDRILARLSRLDGQTPDGGALYSARIIRKLGGASNLVLGIFRPLPDGGGFIEPVAKGAMRELNVATQNISGAEKGELVAVEVLKSGRYGPTQAKVIDRHGPADSERAASRIAIVQFEIPHIFPHDTLEEAKKAQPAKMGKREDWRDIPLITIDPADARDHDDAVFAEPDPKNPDGWIVTVAIADVAAYVTPKSALDREALKRGNSVYFPDLVVPMLPERISNDLCSLREGEDRPALAVRMVIGKDGQKQSHKFHRIMMRSHAKLSYEQAQAAIDGEGKVPEGILDGVLAPLWKAYAALKTARDQREPLDLDLPERKLVLDKDGAVLKVHVPPRLDAHRLIEEFMIQANVCAAETLEQRESPLLYRVHDTPSHAKVEALGEFLASIDLKGPKVGNLRPAHFNSILAKVRDTELEELTNQVVLRSQAQAEYLATNYGHFGLNLRRYAHFTSPIRRYADLVVHRALISALKLGDDGLTQDLIDRLDNIAGQISDTERRAMKAERATIDRLIAYHMSGKVGAEFTGRISGVTRAGLFVELDETGADGFIPISRLSRDYFHYDQAGHTLIGERTGEIHRLGDNVEVRLVEARGVAGALRFDLISEGSYSPEQKTTKKRKGTKRQGPRRGKRRNTRKR